MPLATLLRRFLFPGAPDPVAKLFPASGAHPLAMITGVARDLCFHSIESARNVFGDVRDFDVAENVFELRRDAVASGDRFAERDRFADYSQICAAGTAELKFLRRLGAALWTKHSASPLEAFYADQPSVVRSKREMPRLSSRHSSFV